MKLPREVAERIDRVLEYHTASKHTYDSVRAAPNVPEVLNRPNPYRLFEDRPKVALPTTLMDAPASALSLLASGLASLPESQLHPEQDLRTLATWLYMAYGLTQLRQGDGESNWLRSCPSNGALYPCEIYVVALGIANVEPGLYHYSPREFALRKLRDGGETLAHIRRGRPDLDFVKSVPALMLVSTIYWRSAWKYQRRGYRCSLIDAGRLTENIVAAGNGLGIQTVARLRVPDAAMRELIGVPPEASFGEIEAVQSMVVWADEAQAPFPAPAGAPTPDVLPPITRLPLSASAVTYGSIEAVHQDCVAPGAVVRDVRPPITDVSPLSASFPSQQLGAEAAGADLSGGEALRKVLLEHSECQHFARHGIARPAFGVLNRLAFRSGSLSPISPGGPHVGLIRPFWIVHDVTGMDSGVWYYNPLTDRWSIINAGDFRLESAYLCLEQQRCAESAAVCVMVSTLKRVMHAGGPDLYRLAHLEAGVAAQRLYLAAGAMQFGCSGIAAVYDEELRKFLGVEKTGWEPIFAMAIGIAANEAPEEQSLGDQVVVGWQD